MNRSIANAAAALSVLLPTAAVCRPANHIGESLAEIMLRNECEMDESGIVGAMQSQGFGVGDYQAQVTAAVPWRLRGRWERRRPAEARQVGCIHMKRHNLNHGPNSSKRGDRALQSKVAGFGPMRLAILGLAGFALAGCDYVPSVTGGGRGTAVGPDTVRRAEFIAVVERAGCRLDQSDNEAVLVPAGFSDAEAGALGGLLVSEGAAEISDGDGDLVLLTENCI